MRIRKAVIAAVLLAVPALAWGQAVTQDGQRTDPGRRGTGQGMVVGGIDAETLFVIPRFDGSNNLKTAEAFQDRDNWTVFSSLISRQYSTTAADSSLPQSTSEYRRLALVFYVQLDSLTPSARFAVQVRSHATASADSSNTYAWHRWPYRSTTVGTDVDSVGHITNQTLTTAGSGEFYVVVRPEDKNTRGIYVPLVEHGGSWFWAPFTSIKVRALTGIKSRAQVRVDLMAGS